MAGQALCSAQIINGIYLDLLALDLPQQLVHDVTVEVAKVVVSDRLTISPENAKAPASWAAR